MSRWWLLPVLLALPLSAFAQQSVTKTVSTAPTTAYAVDRRGDFYLASSTGTLSKYDSAGNEQVNWSPRRIGQITLVDPWNPLKVFVFYREFQTIVILDRFLNPTAEYDLADRAPGFVRLACPSQDNSFWMVDDSYHGLLKYDPLDQQVKSRIPFNDNLPADGKIVFMREYQNVLFALLNTGSVLLFDNLGSFQGKVETPASAWVGFEKNQMYALNDDSLWKHDLYHGTASFVTLPKKYVAVLRLSNKIVGIKKEGGFDLLLDD